MAVFRSCNRRKSQLRRLKNRFFVIFSSQNDTFRSQIADLFRGCLPYLPLKSCVMSSLSIPHQPQLLVISRPNATENRPDPTLLCHLRALLCHFATLLRHSEHDTNSDLRPIACDFLTGRIRVGGLPSAIKNRIWILALPRNRRLPKNSPVCPRNQPLQHPTIPERSDTCRRKRCGSGYIEL